MPSVDANLWPMNLNSRTVDPHVDWPMVPGMHVKTATPALIRAVTRNQLLLLRDRNPLHWELLSPECQEAAMAIIEGRREAKQKPVAKAGSKKDELLAKLAAIMEEAESDRDLGAQLKTVEMEAKLEALLNQKTTDEDRNVTINIVTGIQR